MYYPQGSKHYISILVLSVLDDCRVWLNLLSSRYQRIHQAPNFLIGKAAQWHQMYSQQWIITFISFSLAPLLEVSMSPCLQSITYQTVLVFLQSGARIFDRRKGVARNLFYLYALHCFFWWGTALMRTPGKAIIVFFCITEQVCCTRQETYSFFSVP